MGLKEAFGQRLRMLRNERELTLDQLADRVNRAVDTLSLIERGKTWPSVNTIEALAKGLGVPIPLLFNNLPMKNKHHSEDQLGAAIDALVRLPKTDLEVAVVILQAMVRRH